MIRTLQAEQSVTVLVSTHYLEEAQGVCDRVILPFSAMFAGLTTMCDRDWGIMRELLVAPIHRVAWLMAGAPAALRAGRGPRPRRR